MEREEENYQELFTELTRYEKSGIRMQINGYPASPMQIVSAHMLREEQTYMRDYVMDDRGIVRELDFYRIELEKMKDAELPPETALPED